ncbi:hypothetical protein (macronuclear) [Paramecium tetraurelia strain d4-2]|uniref:Uncharacterized protein n=1 Tax=Paramecium tetraurelia TaxID=5888 RepID=Q6BFB7_PARTE|nr:hypothetical protein [Paramecium tetraurelia strain d4-2]CAH03654.1 hypothetical protein PTMB.453c [Paramecium tetraurelia]
MIKLEAHTFHNKNVSQPMLIQDKSPIDIVRQKKIIFRREQINDDSNFFIQTEDSQEIISIKPDNPDFVMNHFTKIALSDDISDFQALEFHDRAAKLLEFYTLNQIQVQYTSVLFSKINYAIMLKRYAAYEESLGLLLECEQILKIKGKTLKKGTFDAIQMAKIIQNKLLRLRVMFQITLLFSETKRNKQALDIAKDAVKVLRSILQSTIKLCQQITLFNNVNKKQRANSEINSPNFKNSISLQCQPQQQSQPQNLSYPQIVEIVFKEILNSIRSVIPYDDKSNEGGSQNNLLVRNHQNRSQSLFTTEQIFQTQANNQQNKLFSVIDDQHPLLQMQILGLMQLTYVDLEELFPINSYEMVIAEEVILELIMLTGLSFYSISTELRFLNLQQNKMNIEIWLGKALEIFYTFVPHSSSIFTQIYQVYRKLYGVDKQSIPEDEEVEYHTKLLKPHAFNNRATLSNKLVIVVKVPILHKSTQDPHKMPQQTNATITKLQQTLTAKKQILYPQKHSVTQQEAEKKFETQQEELVISPKQQQQLFIKKYKILQPQLDIKQRVDILMNQILTQQSKLTQEKLKQKHTPITTLKQKYHVSTKIYDEPKQVTLTNSQQLKTAIPVSRSLSNSRKASQVHLKGQNNNSAKTAQLRYRNQINTLPGDEPSKQIAQQISTQVASLNRQSNVFCLFIQKYFLLKRTDSAKKSKIPFQQR